MRLNIIDFRVPTIFGMLITFGSVDLLMNEPLKGVLENISRETD